jgi:AraC family transcriptional regulator
MVTDQRLRLRYLHGGVVQYRPGETLGPRVLRDYELVLVIEGSVSYQANLRTYAVPPGSVILARPGFHEMYRWDPEGPTRHAFLHFDIEQMPGVWPEAAGWPIVRTEPDSVLAALFRHMLHRVFLHRDWPAQSPGRDDCCVVETLVNIFLEEHGSESAGLERDRPLAVARAINVMRQSIEDDPYRPLSLGVLAKAADVNEKHLCRLFQRALGFSPMETYRMLCLQLSLALLARSNLTIKQIAYRCGFEDPAYFSRRFSRVFGRSPREVRRRLNEGLLPPTSPLPADVTPRLSW